METLYRITKTLSGGFRSTDIPGRKQNGKFASSIEEELTCWKHHFKKVLNQECPTKMVELNEGVDTLNIDIEVPAVEESNFLRTGKPQGSIKFMQKC